MLDAIDARLWTPADLGAFLGPSPATVVSMTCRGARPPPAPPQDQHSAALATLARGPIGTRAKHPGQAQRPPRADCTICTKYPLKAAENLL